MTVNKITTAPTSNEVTDKINEIIDNLGGSITVDQTYDATSANAQSGVAIAGAGFLENKGTGTSSVAVVGTATGSRGVSIGAAAKASGSYSTGIGTSAKAEANYSIQIGYGTNSTASTLSIGFNASSSADRKNWELLDGTTGLIPDARLSSNISRTSDLSNKADIDLTNLSVGLTNTICTTPATTTSTASSATPAAVTENYVNGTSWYRVYSDGWCEQGGRITGTNSSTNVSVNLLKSYLDTNYSMQATMNNSRITLIVMPETTNSFTHRASNTESSAIFTWQASGYIR